MFSERITSKSGLITENELKKVVYKRYMVYICIYGVIYNNGVQRTDRHFQFQTITIYRWLVGLGV